MRNSTTINSRQCRRTTVKQLLSLLLLYQLVLLSLCPLSLTAAAAEDHPPEKSTPLQGGVTRYATGAQDQLNTSPTLRPQAPMMDNSTPAPYPLHADKFGGSAVETAPPRFGVGTAMTAPSPAPQFSLRANRYGNYPVLDVTQMRALAKYDLEIIIDRSLSMRRRDCPGNLSRWDWTGYQAQELAAALSPYAPQGMTISRFASDFDVHERASPQQVASIMQFRDFQYGTRLSQPLEARLDAFFRRYKKGDKPLLIAVITDGRPFPRPEPRMVRDVLVRASMRMKDPTQVKVVFLQIGGNDERGEAYLLSLANNLVDDGARFPYVRTVTFYELVRTGLSRALVDIVQQVR